MLPDHPPSEKTGRTPLALACLTNAEISAVDWSSGTLKPFEVVTVTK